VYAHLLHYERIGNRPLPKVREDLIGGKVTLYKPMWFGHQELGVGAKQHVITKIFQKGEGLFFGAALRDIPGNTEEGLSCFYETLPE